MYDIVIVGAGPAGATLARLLRKDYKILLLDTRDQDAAPGIQAGKCCGGLLAPDAQHMLGKLGLGVPRDVLVGPQLFAVRTLDFDNGLERFYQRHYINIDRSRFDQWLVSLVGDHVTQAFGCRYKKHTWSNEGVEVICTDAFGERPLEARIIIGADGAHSRVRNQAFPNRPAPDPYFSIQECFESESAQPFFSSIFDREITDFYSWTIPKEGNLIVGSAIPVHRNSHDCFEALKAKLANHGYNLGQKIWRKGAYLHRPTSLNQLSCGDGRTALVGEAAGWISPSSAEGISYALKSAWMLAESLNQGLNDFSARYIQKTRALHWNIFLKIAKSPGMYQPQLRKLAMRSGFQSMRIVR